MKKSIVLFIFMIIVVACVASPVVAGSVEPLSNWITSSYIGSKLVDKGHYFYYNDDATVVTIGLRGLYGVVRGEKENYCSSQGTYHGDSYNVDHDLNNEAVTISAY